MKLFLIFATPAMFILGLYTRQLWAWLTRKKESQFDNPIVDIFKHTGENK